MIPITNIDANELIMALWSLSNLVTGVAFFVISYEIWGWLRKNELQGFYLVGWLFILFISSCGLYHVLMVRFIFQYYVDFFQLIFSLNMMFTSLITASLLVRCRRKIRRIINLAEKQFKKMKSSAV